MKRASDGLLLGCRKAFDTFYFNHSIRLIKINDKMLTGVTDNFFAFAFTISAWCIIVDIVPTIRRKRVTQSRANN